MVERDGQADGVSDQLDRDWWQTHKFRTLLRFETHLVTPADWQKRKERLTTDLLANFDRDAINIVFTENILGTRQHEQTFRQGLKRFKSFTKAELYTQLVNDGVENSSEAIIMSYLDDLVNLTSADPRLGYRLMVRQVLDDLSQSGYRIQPALEITGSLRSQYPLIPGEVSQLHLIQLFSRYKDQVQALQEYIGLSRHFIADRNSLIVKQLTAIRNKASAYPRTTLNVILGNLHTEIVELMDTDFRDNLTASSQSFDESGYGEASRQMFYALCGLPVLPKTIIAPVP